MSKNSLLDALIIADGSKNIKNKTLHDFFINNNDSRINLFQSEYEKYSNTNMFKTKNQFNWLADKVDIKINWGGNFSTPANIDKNTTIGKMNLAKLEKAMNKVYNFTTFGLGCISLQEFFNINKPVSKKIYIQEYEEHRRNLEYKKLKNPKEKYYVFYTDRNCLEVPKMYYDFLDIPVRE